MSFQIFTLCNIYANKIYTFENHSRVTFHIQFFRLHKRQKYRTQI